MVHKISFISDTNCKFRVLKTTLSSDNSLERLTALIIVIFTVIVYYSERTLIKLAKGKNAWGKVKKSSKI